VTYESVKETFSGFDNVEVLSGKVEDIVPKLPDQPLSFVHFDINVDETLAVEILPILYRRLLPAGILLFDNYYFRYFSKYNIDSFAQAMGQHVILMPSIPQGMLIKSDA
jgi:predicted O-methyltransferase YrrM